MSTPLETLNIQLQKDLTEHHLDRFISDLQGGLGNSAIDSTQAKTSAAKLLVDARIIPNLQIDGDTGGKITLEDTNKKQFLLSAATPDTALITGADSKTYSFDQTSNSLIEKTATQYQGDANNPNEHFNERDTNGRITKNPNVKYDYDAAGNLTKVSWQSNGQTTGFEKKENGWVDNQGKPFLHDPVLDQKTGNLSFQLGTTAQPGDPTVYRPDASSIHFDQSGTNIISEKYANGDNRAFKYDGNHNLTEVDYTPKGANAVTEKRKLEDGVWKDHDGSDAATTKAPLKAISLDADGNYTETNSDGTKRAIGSSGLEIGGTRPTPDAPDEKSMSVHQRWVKHHATEKVAIDQDIQASNKHTVAFGDTMWDIAKSSLKKNSDNDQASTAEINAEIARLAKNNKITNPGSVPIGTEIDTSPDRPKQPADPNAETGTQGQTLHYDGNGKADNNITEVDYPPSAKYPNGMKVAFQRNADLSIKEVDITGGGDQDGKLVKNGDHYDRTNTDGSTSTVANVTIDPADGEVTLVGAKSGTTPAQDIGFEADGTVKTAASQAPPPDANVKTGDKGQVIHFDGKGQAPLDVTEIDYPKTDKYPKGMKATMSYAANGDLTEVDITGGGDQDCKIVNENGQWTRTAGGKSEPIATISVSPTDGHIHVIKTTTGTTLVGYVINPDGTVTPDA